MNKLETGCVSELPNITEYHQVPLTIWERFYDTLYFQMAYGKVIFMGFYCRSDEGWLQF